nr:hypothetical protein [Gemmatimonadota bacterium]NIR73651.1 hypothetical protein [Candidatus Kutchimonas denitrificans]NIR99610.1 hypothetical protein [Gemmatimonadota bacterium]NIT65230.1 hypothetical protein [Gemmatimonadota bacterium]NIV23763.1 hypothetical protein [Gemmatimonadota bacterium]
MFRKALALLGLPLAFAACERGATAPTDTPAAPAALEAPPPVQGANSTALVRTTWPSAEDPGPPYYARIEPVPPHVFIVDGWAVIQFYRDPDCIPEGFNLLAFFDPPAAFGCPLTVQGFNLWEGEVFAGAPRISQTQGTGAVPFWFIPADAVIDAMQDGELTIGELEGLTGRIVGHATHFHETLYPIGGGHPSSKLIQSA